MRLILFILIAVWATTIASLVRGAESSPYVSEQVTARLLVAENGVADGSRELSAGFEVVLADGWKTYWRSPGEVGLPPQLDWSASTNVAGVDIFFPAPKRFEAFGVQNVGYEREVVYPLRVKLERPGEPARLAANATILVCEAVCVPEVFELAVDLPVGGEVDREAAARIADFAARVPRGLGNGIKVERVARSLEGLVLDVRANASLADPQLFLEAPGEPAFAFGKPRRLGGEGATARYLVPAANVPDRVSVTALDGERMVEWADAPVLANLAPLESGASLLSFVALAFLGGLILNLMPCVLPVLAIKLGSAIQSRGDGLARIRSGFLLSAAGVMTFVLALATVLAALKASGALVGWGMQFQSPLFLTFVIVLLALFAASMFGLFQIRLPSALNNKLGTAGSGYAGDFATGAFAALLATPCSAPFLGTAVAFALAGGATETFAIFAALGAGLALPYLLVALFPGTVRLLPKPGAWMNGLRLVLGAALAATALWLVWVLTGVAGWAAALAVAVIVALATALVALPVGAFGRWRGAAATAAVLAAFAVPFAVGPPAPRDVSDHVWTAFQPAAIADHVAKGRTVFVDVTADWCLTCKVNKAAVLDMDAVQRALAGENVTAMRGDWTRPDDAILRYLKANRRSGIPFNAVYGPGAPEGIVLSELLTRDAVMEALERARGG